MDAAYESALCVVADAYERSIAQEGGGKSLSRVATIVANSGAFFVRLREGRPFSTRNLDKFADWFRRPANWPAETIPHDAASALSSIGRPPLDNVRHNYRIVRQTVDYETRALPQRDQVHA